MFQSVRQRANESFQMSVLQGLPHSTVLVRFKGIEIQPQGPTEEHRFLDKKTASEFGKKFAGCSTPLVCMLCHAERNRATDSFSAYFSCEKICRKEENIPPKITYLKYLGNDGQTWPDVVKSHSRRVESVDYDRPVSGFDDAKQSQGQRTLPGSCSTDNANFFSARDLTVHAPQNQIQFWSISCLIFVENNISSLWPRWIGTFFWNIPRSLQKKTPL